MASKSLIVVGAGSGGYAAALEAAQRGLSVTLVDSAEVGGTCLNRGCIPSKFFLSRAKHAHEPATPMGRLVDQKNAVLATLRQRMEQAAKTASVQRIGGSARLLSAHEVEVTCSDKRENLKADGIILATGSSPIYPTAFPKHPAVFTSDTIFSIEYLPAHVVVVGGGYIGAELACAFQGLGSKVTLIEKEKALLATQPEFSAAAPVLQRSFEKRGMTVWTSTEVKTVAAANERKLLVACSNGETIEANALLLAMGRRPNMENLGLNEAGVSVDRGPCTVERGTSSAGARSTEHGARIVVNDFMQTSVPSIYAIGDLVSPVPLAHTAAKEAEIAVKHFCGETAEKLEYSRIPRVVYTWPEAAAIGLTESQAQSAGHKTRIDRYHFAASSKAMVDGETEGFWMILSDAQTAKILGALIVGPQATELIHLVALSLRAGLATSDIADTVFAHPTLSEGFQEAMRRSVNASNISFSRPQDGRRLG